MHEHCLLVELSSVQTARGYSTNTKMICVIVTFLLSRPYLSPVKHVRPGKDTDTIWFTFRFSLPPRVAGPRKNIHMNAAYCLNCPASRFVQPIDDIDFRYCYQLLSGLGKLFDTFLFSLTLRAAAWPGRFNHGPCNIKFRDLTLPYTPSFHFHL